ncbi:MaoC family dehydratase [Nocardioides campestrisoli]|uniref:MaoC family dehydratase n=1 Tax=Nocardioides campestrisoli TaxID=2736757 RepID=UPI00163DA441|nr:MaoC family dehydratase [Nocardioides campestrisoli]
MRVLNSIEEIEAAVGEPLGTTEWVTMDQKMVDTFADLTGDHQWIHVDPERAAQSSFGGTIVHGLLTLGMLPGFGLKIFRIDAGSARLNYGSEKVRFPAPLRTGTRVRGSATFVAVDPVPSGTQVRTRWTVEAEGSERPVCVAETITLVLP